MWVRATVSGSGQYDDAPAFGVYRMVFHHRHSIRTHRNWICVLICIYYLF